MASSQAEGQRTAHERDCPEGHGKYLSRYIGKADDARAAPWNWSRCPACEAAHETAEAQRRAVARARRVENLVASSGLAGRYVRATFDSYECATDGQRVALARCRAFAAGDTPGALFLVGRPGTGKTHLAASVVRARIERTASEAILITFSELVRQVRDTWRKDSSRTESEVIGRFAAAALLAIDDVGATFGTDAERKTLLDVIDLRYTHELPTVIVSNLTMQELEQAIGERAFDRLREGASVVPFAWDSHRRRARLGVLSTRQEPADGAPEH